MSKQSLETRCSCYLSPSGKLISPCSQTDLWEIVVKLECVVSAAGITISHLCVITLRADTDIIQLPFMRHLWCTPKDKMLLSLMIAKKKKKKKIKWNWNSDTQLTFWRNTELCYIWRLYFITKKLTLNNFCCFLFQSFFICHAVIDITISFCLFISMWLLLLFFETVYCCIFINAKRNRFWSKITLCK